MDTVQELEHYLNKNAVDLLLKDLMVQCLKEKPEEPIHYLLKRLMEMNAGKGSEEVAVASDCVSEGSSSKCHLAVTHPDKATQLYLTEKKVHVILLEFLKRVATEKPDNVLSFLALEAHNLQKDPPPGVP